ncbi:hypothetical protein NA57DRAFT_34024 [Rhizodiscina lignyota]|uniref:DUF1772-domain-containing protein n=1 Tax=Rhizodiscina lignyota TaxID=1504668 RepID=A0A9P4MBH7_9PEZI|nr:hypothetical protein NA57DRAFT_34024 [Rhizodiscina lignyota]
MADHNLFYHEKVPVGIRIAGTVGITAAAFLAGQSASSSYIATPALLQAPAPLLAKQWKTMWLRGRPTGVLFLAIGAIFGGLAYREQPSSSAFKLYVTSAALITSAVPYTLALMGPTNKALNEKAESLASASITDAAAEAGVEKEQTTHALVDRWAMLNLGRALIAATSAMVALWANVSAIEVVEFGKVGLTAGANRMG